MTQTLPNGDILTPNSVTPACQNRGTGRAIERWLDGQGRETA